jgi:signal transduction histidine kinase
LGRTLLHAIERKSRSLAQLDLLERERVARSEAEKAAGIRDEFLSVASHELRNPLTSLKMQMQLLIKTVQKGEKNSLSDELVQTLAEKADAQIDRFGKLIDTLLNFSQIQSGRLKLDYSKFEFNQIIRDTVERFSSELKSANCEIILNLGPPVEGEWDLLRVEQVLINLLSNVVKYAPGKPVTVSVTSDKEKVWIRIKDQGPGIPAQDRERIFQRFERAKDTQAVPGLGLGLYVVRQIIDTHGGTIGVSSELGTASTFTVCLPRTSRGKPPEFLTPNH